MQEECAVLFWGGGRSYTKKETGPSGPLSATFRSPAPQPSLPRARTKGDAGRRAPLPPRASDFQDAFHLGPLQELDL